MRLLSFFKENRRMHLPKFYHVNTLIFQTLFFFFFFFKKIQFYVPLQDYFSSYETGQSDRRTNLAHPQAEHVARAVR